MKEEGKIFIVTRGEYSDYTIDSVFSTRKRALDYLDTKDDNFRLEVYDLDKPVVHTTTTYRISFRLDKKKVHRVSQCANKYKDLIQISSWCFNELKTIDIYIESDSRKRALKIASERYGAIIAGEQTIYPYLRVGVIRRYGDLETAYFDFHTGEMVLFGEQQLAFELPPFIKVKRITKE